MDINRKQENAYVQVRSSLRSVCPDFNLFPQVVQDGPARAYTTDTVVTTQTIYPVQVLSMTRLNSVFTKYVSGYSGEHLTLTVSPEESFGWIFSQ